VSELKCGPLLTNQACACPDEQEAHSLTRTRGACQSIVGSDFRLPSGSMAVEKILMSRLCEGAQHFGVHLVLLENEKKVLMRVVTTTAGDAT
jgi:hypothetical protein